MIVKKLLRAWSKGCIHWKEMTKEWRASNLLRLRRIIIFRLIKKMGFRSKKLCKLYQIEVTTLQVIKTTWLTVAEEATKANLLSKKDREMTVKTPGLVEMMNRTVQMKYTMITII